MGRLALVPLTIAIAALLTGATFVPTVDPTPSPGVGAAAQDPARTAEYWLDEYGVRTAWQTTRGKGSTIAIIDTGIGRSPVEFSGAVAGGADFSGAAPPTAASWWVRSTPITAVGWPRSRPPAARAPIPA
ncbi:MAG: hypothetical protein R2692_07540 [Microbacterium sp.]